MESENKSWTFCDIISFWQRDEKIDTTLESLQGDKNMVKYDKICLLSMRVASVLPSYAGQNEPISKNVHLNNEWMLIWV